MSYTPAGNLRPPPRVLICQWVVKAWLSIDREIITKSFKTCAISNALDASEDNEILCLRDDEHSPIVREDVRVLSQDLLANNGNYTALNLDARMLLIEEDGNDIDRANDSDHSLMDDSDGDGGEAPVVQVPVPVVQVPVVQVPVVQVPVPIVPVPVGGNDSDDSDISVAL